ncbi:MAG: 30S ribosomal protein S8e [Candidatus Heimdallarchaeota archaeon]|nr:30S ribosomal protein S8e [Candidatus Heimdallarchaeota archaeon]MCK5049118.1 30S ribosomal protein S8e [Candidatus Heimdallarchaeota archaeon]
MVKDHGRSRRKITGGLFKSIRKKRLSEMGRPSAETAIGEVRRKLIRTRGGNRKVRVLADQFVNVMDSETGISKNVKIDDVEVNPASRYYSRRRIITKGAVLATELGRVKVTSRPGQHGSISGVLLKEQVEVPE